MHRMSLLHLHHITIVIKVDGFGSAETMGCGEDAPLESGRDEPFTTFHTVVHALRGEAGDGGPKLPGVLFGDGTIDVAEATGIANYLVRGE